MSEQPGPGQQLRRESLGHRPLDLLDRITPGEVGQHQGSVLEVFGPGGHLIEVDVSSFFGVVRGLTFAQKGALEEQHPGSLSRGLPVEHLDPSVSREAQLEPLLLDVHLFARRDPGRDRWTRQPQ